MIYVNSQGKSKNCEIERTIIHSKGEIEDIKYVKGFECMSLSEKFAYKVEFRSAVW